MAAKTLTPEEISQLKHNFIGPTWRKSKTTGKWILPDHTLGWQIAEWCATYLNHLDGSGKPFQFTLEQLRFVLWWYALDEHGRFIYRTGVLQRMKGWGKDPLLAVLCLVEFLGPSRFAGWDAEGNPIGTRELNAWVQVTAVNQTQTRNTMALIPVLLSDKLKAEHGVKMGAELIRANSGKQLLEAVTSSYRAIEGKRTTFTLLNETHHWVTGNNGDLMYLTIDGNATKMDSRYLAITNAYIPGEGSVAQKMREAYDKIASGRAPSVGFLYDSIEAHASTPLSAEALRIVLPKIRGDAIWLNIETIIQSVLNLTIDAARSRRMYLNQVVADEDALHGPETWDPLEDEDLILLPKDEIVMGFDGGKTDDATVLVGLRVSDMAVFVLHIQERPEGPDAEGWEVDRDKASAAVEEAFRLYDVQGFYADVALWESYLDQWAAEYGEGVVTKASGTHPFAWDMRQSLQKVTLAHERLLNAIFDKKLKHNGDPDLRRHVLNTYRRENRFGLSFGKQSRESPRKVDLYAAMMLAHEALHDLRTRVKPKKKRTGRGHFL